MNILHLSHTDLKYDSRIRKAMVSGMKYGFNCSFQDLGYSNSKFNNLVISGHIPYFWGKIRGKVEKAIKGSRADIIHAHDIYSARICQELDVPFIFDSHENWISFPRHPYRNLLLRHFKHKGLDKFSNWCKDIIAAAPTLTVNQTIVDLYRRFGRRVYLVPNYITVNESSEIKFKPKTKGVSYVYVGDDYPNRNSFRNIDRFVKLFLTGEYGTLHLITNKSPKLNRYVLAHRFMEHKEFLDYLTQFVVGSLYYEPCPDHHYILANKFSEYAHAGLCILYVNTLTNIDRILGNLGVRVEPNELEAVLANLKGQRDFLFKKGAETRRFAVKSLVWETYEGNIFRAYKEA